MKTILVVFSVHDTGKTYEKTFTGSPKYLKDAIAKELRGWKHLERILLPHPTDEGYYKEVSYSELFGS